MGRKQRQVCFGLRLLVLLAVLIVIAPSWFFSIDTYFALMRFARKGLSFKEDEGADIVFTNATIWTGDSIHPWAEFMVLRKGRILRVGNLTQLQYMRIGPKMEVVDLEGKFVTPGFIDSHLHFLHGGLQMKHVDLGCVNSRAEFERKFRIAAEDVESGKWIIGSMWNEENWGGTLPEASWIDNVTPHHPVWACRIDVHTCLANSMAMALANISRDTVDPEGGTVVKNIHGDPTGLFKDMASRLITHHIPPMSVEERREALIRASELALSRGVTSVVDFGRIGASEHPWDDFREVYLWADAAGMMRVRVSIFLPIETWQSVIALVRQRGFILSQWLHIGGVKAFADGSLGTRTALFHKAYADDNSNYGLLALDLDWLQEAVLGADNAGLQVAVHAIGDAANDHVLSIFETVVSKNGPRDRRFRIEHAQHLSAGAPERFQANGVVASVQPEHMLDDAYPAMRKLGEERAQQGSFLFNSLLGNGTHLALGSDWTVAPIDPLRGIQAATTRIPKGWSSSWIPSEIISSEAALSGYTREGAYASFMEKYVGSLSPGKYADFVLLSHSPLNDLARDGIPSVLATYVGGCLAHPKPT